MSLRRRIDGLVFVVLAVFYALVSLGLEEGISRGVVSSKTFPLAIAALLFFLGLLLAIQNQGSDHSKIWPSKAVWGKIFVFIFLMVFYALVLDYLGFLLATTLICTYVGVSLRGTLVKSLLASCLICLFVQVLFVFALEINLPLGSIIDGLLN